MSQTYNYLPEPIARKVTGKVYRLIPSHFPPITLFEHLLDAEELDLAYELESMTNTRLRQEAGDISLVPVGDRIVGPGSTPIMAAFTHIGFASRFTNGDFGVYYAARTLEVALAETIHHRQCFLSATSEPACKITMRCYVSAVKKPLEDIRSEAYDSLHHVSDYTASQSFSAARRSHNSWGLWYRSVREPSGECVAVFKPSALSVATQGQHYQYHWNGKDIERVVELRELTWQPNHHHDPVVEN